MAQNCITANVDPALDVVMVAPESGRPSASLVARYYSPHAEVHMAKMIGRVTSIIMLTTVATLSVTARTGAGGSPSSSLTREQTRAVQIEVKALLTKQVDAWNRGDLQAFMEAYWDSPDLMFFSNGRMLRGREQIAATMRDRYRQAMGRLVFGEPHFGVTNADAAVFWGEWRLELPNGQERRGLGTAVVRKINGAWRIIHDHSSYSSTPSASGAP